MKARLFVNGHQKRYPQKISDLESLILFLIGEKGYEEEIIIEVDIDGKVYSEEYAHHSRDVDLREVEDVEIRTISKEEMCRDFIDRLPDYIETLVIGFRSTAELLKDEGRVETGFDMLAKSFEALHALKSHLENVRSNLGEGSESGDVELFWKNFDELADEIINEQKAQEPRLIAGLLDKRMMPILEDWKRSIEKDEGHLSLGIPLHSIASGRTPAQVSV